MGILLQTAYLASNLEIPKVLTIIEVLKLISLSFCELVTIAVNYSRFQQFGGPYLHDTLREVCKFCNMYPKALIAYPCTRMSKR